MPANVTTIIGRAARVRGRISGDADLAVLGLVEGDISVNGDVTIEAEGIVGASVRGRRLVVRGAVKGDLVGEKAVVLEDGARVLGDIRAPRITITQGALVRGYVQTADDEVPAEAPARALPAARPAATPAAARMPVASARAVPAAAPQTSPSPRVVAKPEFMPGQSAAAGAAKRTPPPPVVPSLKKLKGQLLKKKER